MRVRLESYYQRKFKRALFQMAAWILVGSIIWTLSGIYAAWHKEKGIEVDKEIMRPISVKFDTETLKNLETRQSLPIDFQLQEASSSLRGQK